MAKLKALPSLAVISGFKGVIDFYVNYQTCPALTGEVGQPCARKWPVTPLSHRSPGEQASWEAWAWAAANWNSLSQEVKTAYLETAQGSSLTGRDLFTKSFISDYFREGQWP